MDTHTYGNFFLQLKVLLWHIHMPYSIDWLMDFIETSYILSWKIFVGLFAYVYISYDSGHVFMETCVLFSSQHSLCASD